MKAATETVARAVAVLLAAIGFADAQQLSVGSVRQSGGCTVAGVIGNVVVNCPGVDRSVIKTIEVQFNARLKDRDLTIEKLTKEANDWKDKFVDLTFRFAALAAGDSLKQKAEQLLKAGKFDEAGRTLDEVLAREEIQI